MVKNNILLSQSERKWLDYLVKEHGLIAKTRTNKKVSVYAETILNLIQVIEKQNAALLVFENELWDIHREPDAFPFQVLDWVWKVVKNARAVRVRRRGL